MMMGISNDVNQSSSEQSYRGEDGPIDLLEDTPLFICHELRTPLTSIHGALGLLHTGQLGTLSDEGRRVLAIAINNANRLTRLANAIENKPALPMTILSEDRMEELQLENELYEAFDRQEFNLVYQPIISIERADFSGYIYSFSREE
jgi:c-di-GMP phosphodiesterase